MESPLAEERLWIDGPVGRLEAIHRPSRQEVERCALLCHPHPLFGGTMMNKTLYRVAKRLPEEAAMPNLRFNFRGAGASDGSFDNGEGEQGDVAAALDVLSHLYPDCPISLIGYSFGAVVGLRAGLVDARVDRLVALGLPLDHDWDLDFLRELAKPTLFVHGENDEFGSAAQLESFVAELPPFGRTHVVPTANHLFQGQEDAAVDAVVQYLHPDKK